MTTYSYDAANNLFTLLNPFGEKTTFTYDALNRAVTVTQANTTIEQSFFNAAGWLTTIRHQKSDGTTLSAFTYTYDNNGNTILKNASSQVTTYTYDNENRMTKLQQPTAPAVMTFTYNGLSFRRTLHDGTSLSKFIYTWAMGTPGIDPVLLETDVNDITVVEYTPALMLALLSQRRGTVSRWYHPEAIGSTRLLTDANQTVTDTYLYKAFGELVTSTGTTINPLRYVGMENYYDDGKSGLDLLGLRYYNGLVGRFMTVDPTRNGINGYRYAGNNPVNHIDPTGEIRLGLRDFWDFLCRLLNLFCGPSPTPVPPKPIPPPLPPPPISQPMPPNPIQLPPVPNQCPTNTICDIWMGEPGMCSFFCSDIAECQLCVERTCPQSTAVTTGGMKLELCLKTNLGRCLHPMTGGL